MLLNLPPGVFAEELEQTPALNASNVEIYNNTAEAGGPVGYFDRITTPDTVVRVYDKPGEGAVLLGEAKRNSVLSVAYTPLDSLDESGGYVYVSAQQPGMSESERVSVQYSQAKRPMVDFRIFYLDPKKDTTSSSFVGSQVYQQNMIMAGYYYQVNVMLRNFGRVSSAVLPIKYDTDTLELMGLELNDGELYLSSTPVSETVPESLDGINFDYTEEGVYRYGVLKGDDIAAWGADFATMSTPSVDPDTGDVYRGEYQYINTQTGVIKINCGASNAKTIGTQGRVLKLMFRAKQNASLSSTPNQIIRFATEADYDEVNGSGTFMDRRKYYDIGSPGGASISLWGTNLLMPPISADYGEPITKQTPLKLTAEQTEALPQSLSSAIEAALLPPNKVKIYNFTNYTDSGLSGGTLDEYVDDMLVLTSADDQGAAKADDVIKVYADITDDEADFEGTMGDGEVRIPLGTGFLSREGGTIYITNSRGGQESDKLAFEYPREMSRNVYFKVYSTSMNPDENGADIERRPTALQVKKGDRIRVKVCFEDINELMAYTFPIHFDPAVVRVADADFKELPSGTLTETEYPDDKAGFLDGTEIEPLTFNEILIYYAEEDEIDAIMENMGIDRATFDRIKAEVTLKMERELPWEGGILYTGTRDDEGSTYPYVDNRNGLLKISAVSLVPSGLLEAEGGSHFLTLNFVAVTNGVPNFRFATESKDVFYDQAEPDGGTLHIVGVDTQMQSVDMNDYWNAYWIESPSSEIDFNRGNALSKDINDFGESHGIDENTQFVYYQYKFRDPGFTVYKPNGTIALPEEITPYLKRYYMDGDTRVELPQYREDEVLPTDTGRLSGSTASDGATYFGMSPSDYSKVYDLIYEYTVPGSVGSDGNPVVITATRKVVMIYRLGDVDRDGKIDAADVTTIRNHQSNTTVLDLSDLLYKAKTANASKDANNRVEASSVSALRNHQSNTKLIGQYYSAQNELMTN